MPNKKATNQQPKSNNPPPQVYDFEGFFTLSPDLLCIAGLDGYLKRVNPAFESRLGYKSQELLTTPFLDFIHPDDKAATLDELAKLSQGTPSIYFENRYLCKNGSYRWLAWTTAPLPSKELVYAIARDITPQKQTEADLKEIQARYELVAEGANGGIWDWNLQTNQAYYSSRWKAALGYESDEISTQYEEWFKRIHPEDRDRTLAAIDAHVQGLTPIFELTHRVLHKNGTYLWMLSRGASLRDPNGQIWRLAGSTRNITHYKKVQEDLCRSEERYRSLVEATAQIIWDTNAEGEVVTAQPGWSAFTGQTDDELQGWGWLNAIHPDDQAKTAQMWSNYVNNNYNLYQIEHRLQRYDGEYRHMNVRAVPVREADGSVREWVGIHTDITEQKQAESALSKNSEMLCFLLEHTPAAIAMFDRDMKYQLVSRRYLENYNIDHPSIIGKSHYEVFPELSTNWREIHQRCLQGAGEQCEEDLFVSPNGKKHWEKWEIRPWTDSIGEIKGIILVAEVITEQRLAKEQLRQLNEKLLHSNRDLEQFAYVASHDLQEPLRAVTSYAQLFARKYQSNLDAQADKYINYIVEGATRMQQLIDDLLNFSRIGTHGKELQLIDLETIIATVRRHLKIAIAKSHAVVTSECLPTVTGDKTQLTQLFQNLIANAIKFRKSEPPQIQIKAVQQGKEWLISVSDNGIGMEAEYFERIFIIFQRLHSRAEYPGTGIGLAVCKKIVERHGGRIWVESMVGVGTTFYFTISCSEINNKY